MELLEEILSKENLNEAYKRVVANRGASGVDGVEVKDLWRHLAERKAEILESIRNRKYKPLPVRRVEIPKDNGKMRQLGIPTAVDRVIQQAVSQVLMPIYEKQFSDSSFGFRPNRSCEMAVMKSLELINYGYDWIVDIDLERFFDTVNQDRLMNLIYRTIKDDDVISLIRKFLVSGVLVGNTYEETTIGTPQGGNISPLLSNIMLNELDNELTKRGLHFVRYADDCNIFVRSKKSAERVMKSITLFIEKKLGLIVNASKRKVGRPEDIKFLGFGYVEGMNGEYYSVPHEKSVDKLKRKLKTLTSRSWSVSLLKRFKKINYLIRGWVNYFRITKMVRFLRELDSKLRRRTRVIIWKQWKTILNKYNSLRELGATHDNAFRLANSRRGYWYLSNTTTMNYAMNNEWLASKGLLSLLEHYRKVRIVKTLL